MLDEVSKSESKLEAMFKMFSGPLMTEYPTRDAFKAIQSQVKAEFIKTKLDSDDKKELDLVERVRASCYRFVNSNSVDRRDDWLCEEEKFVDLRYKDVIGAKDLPFLKKYNNIHKKIDTRIRRMMKLLYGPDPSKSVQTQCTSMEDIDEGWVAEASPVPNALCVAPSFVMPRRQPVVVAEEPVPVVVVEESLPVSEESVPMVAGEPVSVVVEESVPIVAEKPVSMAVEESVSVVAEEHVSMVDEEEPTVTDDVFCSTPTVSATSVSVVTVELTDKPTSDDVCVSIQPKVLENDMREDMSDEEEDVPPVVDTGSKRITRSMTVDATPVVDTVLQQRMPPVSIENEDAGVGQTLVKKRRRTVSNNEDDDLSRKRNKLLEKFRAVTSGYRDTLVANPNTESDDDVVESEHDDVESDNDVDSEYVESEDDSVVESEDDSVVGSEDEDDQGRCDRVVSDLKLFEKKVREDLRGFEETIGNSDLKTDEKKEELAKKISSSFKHIENYIEKKRLSMIAKLGVVESVPAAKQSCTTATKTKTTPKKSTAKPAVVAKPVTIIPNPPPIPVNGQWGMGSGSKFTKADKIDWMREQFEYDRKLIPEEFDEDKDHDSIDICMDTLTVVLQSFFAKCDDEPVRFFDKKLMHFKDEEWCVMSDEDVKFVVEKLFRVFSSWCYLFDNDEKHKAQKCANKGYQMQCAQWRCRWFGGKLSDPLNEHKWTRKTTKRVRDLLNKTFALCAPTLVSSPLAVTSTEEEAE